MHSRGTRGMHSKGSKECPRLRVLSAQFAPSSADLAPPMPSSSSQINHSFSKEASSLLLLLRMSSLTLIMQNKSMHIVYSVSCTVSFWSFFLKEPKLFSKVTPSQVHLTPGLRINPNRYKPIRVISLPSPEGGLVLGMWCHSGQWPIRKNLLVEFWERSSPCF